MHIESVISEIRKIANKNPDTVYNRDIFDSGGGDCRYIVNHRGSCIVGRALVNLGFGPVDIARHEGDNAEEVLLSLGVNAGYFNQTEWINRVQFYQDADVPWGKAIIKADALHPLT